MKSGLKLASLIVTESRYTKAAMKLFNAADILPFFCRKCTFYRGSVFVVKIHGMFSLAQA